MEKACSTRGGIEKARKVSVGKNLKEKKLLVKSRRR
jgi:hypothetical protein